MKIKYNWDLIINYITGNDIEDYDIDVLENDVDFMIQVINYTNDKNMYKLCGKSVLNNYRFVKYMIYKFKDDIPFIVEIADRFLENHDDENDYFDVAELNIVMCDILDDDNDEKIKYAIYRNSFYRAIMGELSTLLDEEQENELGLGYGFIAIYDLFFGREQILDFFVSQFVDTILHEADEKSFEEKIHENVKNFKEIRNRGIKTYLINFLRKYDDSLADYVCSHIYLLNSTIKSLLHVEKKWDNYILRDNFRKFNILEKEVYDLFSTEDEFIPNFSACDLLDYVIIKLHLDGEYKKCFGEAALDKEEESSCTIDETKFSIVDYKYYRFAFNLAKELFEKNIIFEHDEYLDEKQGNNSIFKVIKFDFKRKKRTNH